MATEHDQNQNQNQNESIGIEETFSEAEEHYRENQLASTTEERPSTDFDDDVPVHLPARAPANPYHDTIRHDSVMLELLQERNEVQVSRTEFERRLVRHWHQDPVVLALHDSACTALTAWLALWLAEAEPSSEQLESMGVTQRYPSKQRRLERLADYLEVHEYGYPTGSIDPSALVWDLFTTVSQCMTPESVPGITGQLMYRLGIVQIEAGRRGHGHDDNPTRRAHAPGDEAGGDDRRRDLGCVPSRRHG